jgi:hypothetical protein
MVFSSSVEIDETVFKDIADKALNGPEEFFVIYGNVVAAIGNQTVRILSTEPGKPKYPIRWTSERQRRFVMAKLRRMGQIPYIRTGKYAKSWRWQSKSTERGGLFVIENTAKTSRGDSLEQYVQGVNQQGFHKDTGWVATEPTLKKAGEEAELALITGWLDFMGEL